MNGLVTVIPGAASGLDSDASVTMSVDSLDINSGAGHFGGGLALGDIDADGFDELAIGSPLAWSGGRVDIYAGSAAGLALDSHTELLGFDWDTPEGPSGGHFGAALWFGQADTTVGEDLLVGDPFATFVIDGAEVSAGAARLFTSDGTSVSGARTRVLHEGLPGVPGGREKYDRFGNGFPGSSYPW